MLPNFWHLPNNPILKLNNFLWVCWFLGKNLSNYVPPFENSTTRIAIILMHELKPLGILVSSNVCIVSVRRLLTEMTTPLATKMPNCFYLTQFSSSFLSFQYYSYIMIFLRNLTVVHTLLPLLKFFRHTLRVYRTLTIKRLDG